MKKIKRSSYILMIIVGAYLLFADYKMWINIQEGASEVKTIILYSAGILFALVAVVFFGISVFALIKGYYKEKTDEEKDQ